MTDSIRDRIVAIIARQAMLDPEQITPQSTPADLGIDSLGLVESVLAIEEAFGLSIPFDANEPDRSDFDIATMGSIIAEIEALVARKG